MKYKQQYIQPFGVRTIAASVSIDEASVCIILHRGTKRLAERIGNELVCELVCEEYTVRSGESVMLWLDGVDALHLQATGEEFENLVKEIGAAEGYEIVFMSHPSPPG